MSILGSPYLGELPFCPFGTMHTSAEVREYDRTPKSGHCCGSDEKTQENMNSAYSRHRSKECQIRVDFLLKEESCALLIRSAKSSEKGTQPKYA